MFIINQDRDEIIQRRGTLYTMPVVTDGALYGFNLYQEDHMLGTFDSVEEAVAEMARIDSCTDEYCFVDGYCEPDEEELIAALMEEFERELAD
ncbi:MAG: hypothetical protein AAGU27_24850 [Dehalobacterium sp.]